MTKGQLSQRNGRKRSYCVGLSKEHYEAVTELAEKDALYITQVVEIMIDKGLREWE